MPERTSDTQKCQDAKPVRDSRRPEAVASLVGDRSGAPVKMVPIEEIRVGKRRRQNLRDVPALARNIEKRGLMHPIILRDDGVLVSGQKRLEAYRSLGRAEIPARYWKDVKADELRELEVEENEFREPLSDYELSAERGREIEAAEREAGQEAGISIPQNRKSPAKPGRPAKKGSNADIANRTGMSKATVQRTKRHLGATDQYPFLKGDTWPKREAITVGKRLDKMGKRAQEALSKMCEGVAFQTAMPMINHLADMEPEQRKKICQLHATGEPDHQRRAKELAAAARPKPDPASNVAKWIESRAKRGKEQTELSGTDQLFDGIVELAKKIMVEAAKAKAEAEDSYGKLFEDDGLQGRGR